MNLISFQKCLPVPKFGLVPSEDTFSRNVSTSTRCFYTALVLRHCPLRKSIGDRQEKRNESKCGDSSWNVPERRVVAPVRMSLIHVNSRLQSYVSFSRCAAQNSLTVVCSWTSSLISRVTAVPWTYIKNRSFFSSWSCSVSRAVWWPSTFMWFTSLTF